MKTLYKLDLLDPDSLECFQEVNLEACDDAPHDWSVNAYTLRGGLQEGV